MKKYILALIVVSLTVCFAFASDEFSFDKSGVLIKVDSAGLKASITATGRGSAPEKDSVSRPQAKLFAGQAAIAIAYKELLSTLNEIPAYFFPKERHLTEDGYISGAKLTETRYYGDGSVEVDVCLDIALEGLLTERFEKEMRLAGYKVVEFDNRAGEITKEEWEGFIKKQ